MAFIPIYIFILFFLIVIDYAAGLFIEKAKKKQKKYFLIISIISNIGILFVFKYFNFFNTNLSLFMQFLHWNYSPKLLQLALPIGLSFHTFQSLSYVIEVYKGKQKAEHHLGIYATYVMFFPQLVAGPIERPQQLLKQFKETHVIKESSVIEGQRRILFGFFKKVVIADRLAILVNLVYGVPSAYIGVPLILATIAFAFQIYYDFSGYTDIAIGAAKILGFRLEENFNYPYLATSIQDFWRRWHITLYSWFRDYVYIPLGGSHVRLFRNAVNIMIVFIITGLWHGANWTYVIWGIIHGIYLTTSLILRKRLGIIPLKTPRIVNLLYQLITFTLVCVAWIFFRAETVKDAIYVLTHLTKGIGSLVFDLTHHDFYSANLYFAHQGLGLGLNNQQLIIAIIALIIMGVAEYFERKNLLLKMPSFIRWGLYIIIILMIINLGANNKIPFIYFQF